VLDSGKDLLGIILRGIGCLLVWVGTILLALAVIDLIAKWYSVLPSLTGLVLVVWGIGLIYLSTYMEW